MCGTPSWRSPGRRSLRPDVDSWCDLRLSFSARTSPCSATAVTSRCATSQRGSRRVWPSHSRQDDATTCAEGSPRSARIATSCTWPSLAFRRARTRRRVSSVRSRLHSVLAAHARRHRRHWVTARSVARRCVLRAGSDAQRRVAGHLPAGQTLLTSAGGPPVGAAPDLVLRLEAGQVVRGMSAADEPQPLASSLDDVLRAARASGCARREDGVLGVGHAGRRRTPRHTRDPVSLDGGCLLVVVDEPGWATRFRYEQASLLRRFAAELGEGVVTRIDVRVR